MSSRVRAVGAGAVVVEAGLLDRTALPGTEAVAERELRIEARAAGAELVAAGRRGREPEDRLRSVARRRTAAEVARCPDAARGSGCVPTPGSAAGWRTCRRRACRARTARRRTSRRVATSPACCCCRRSPERRPAARRGSTTSDAADLELHAEGVAGSSGDVLLDDGTRRGCRRTRRPSTAREAGVVGAVGPGRLRLQHLLAVQERGDAVVDVGEPYARDRWRRGRGRAGRPASARRCRCRR